MENNNDLSLLKLVDRKISEAILNLEKRFQEQPNYFQMTEKLLENSLTYHNLILDKEEQLEVLKKFGVDECSKDVIEFKSNLSLNYCSEYEIYLNVKSQLEQEIKWLKSILARIQLGINTLKKREPYYKIIIDYYVYGINLDVISQKYLLSVSTVSKYKSKFIEQLSLALFPMQKIKRDFDDFGEEINLDDNQDG